MESLTTSETRSFEEIKQLLTENGLDYENLFLIKGNRIFDGFEGDQYQLLVFRDYPKKDRFREIFIAPTITALYHVIQSGIEQGHLRTEPGA